MEEIKKLLTRFKEDRFNGQIVIKMHKGKFSMVECTARGIGQQQFRRLGDQLDAAGDLGKVLDDE